ncbi:hypothetical protein [Paracoccus spongiarum]|uniref:Uncharacterized protein n=1 Tax=Paracoccus spongiarum TaxID=3064387 RepID=A0ABT9JI43_9RHOB|nr:hypothetical protein [Paracoccus sp. 2205BS29-5]MDP5308717.1 hypothetical protein [Paracoccus sp. 2205BS29-5]
MHNEVSDPDPAELRAATGIATAGCRGDWAVCGVQRVPLPEGPGIEMLFDAPDPGRASHFAVRAGV